METKSFTVKRGTHGLGLFTNVPFKKGDLVTEYTGEKISTDTANIRGGQYLFELNDAWVIDGKGREHKARYINHSCSPNCYPEIDDKEEHIFIYAKRTIKAGEELTYNYGKEFWEVHVASKGCRCDKCHKKALAPQI
jgi:SET domain-containing protein